MKVIKRIKKKWLIECKGSMSVSVSRPFPPFLLTLITVSSIQNPLNSLQSTLQSSSLSLSPHLHGYSNCTFFFILLHLLNQGISPIAFHFIKSPQNPSQFFFFFFLFCFPSAFKDKRSVQSLFCSERRVRWFCGNEGGDERDAFVFSFAFSFTLYCCSSWRYSLTSLAIQLFYVQFEWLVTFCKGLFWNLYRWSH